MIKYPDARSNEPVSRMLDMRLGMSLIVRDEADIIRENIEFHAKKGVDAFAIIDNGSTDGTREILEGLRTSFDLQLFDDRGLHQQARQATFLAQHLRDHQHADWLISNDADEFWLPKEDNLKLLINPSRPAVIASRYNLLPRREDIATQYYKFHHNIMLVHRPHGMLPSMPDPNKALPFPIMLRTYPGKIACSLQGFEYVCQGNHEVKHATGEARHTDDACIFHYQIRGYEKFKSKMRNHGERLRVTTDGSWHLRRWYAAYLAGALRDEYEFLLLSKEQTQHLLAQGVIKEERVIADFFKSPAGHQVALRRNYP